MERIKKISKKIWGIILCVVLAAITLLTPMEGTVVHAAGFYKVDQYGVLYDYAGSTRVKIRSKTSGISPVAFNDINVSSFSVAPSNKYFTAVDGILYSKDMTILIRVPSRYEGAYELPVSVNSIYNNAFKDCTELSSVKLNN